MLAKHAQHKGQNPIETEVTMNAFRKTNATPASNPGQGILYIVSTPIGNLEDITLRALRTLKEVDLIAAEDTRHTGLLLKHFGIRTSLTSYFEGNELRKRELILLRLKQGDHIALVSDAGTPGISDPGFRLIQWVIENQIPVVPIPGPSAAITALSVSGLPTDAFLFKGFLPHKSKKRRDLLKELAEVRETLVFYESPHRLSETLQDLFDILGDREIVLTRELTKVYEEVLRGKLSEVTNQIGERKLKGEITLVIAGRARKKRMMGRDGDAGME
jgi:16S rRNA (cytidine1402-2'-O)-methyltransferase